MNQILSLVGCLAVGLSAQAATPYSDWQHSGTFYIITTPEGADLPASATEKNFPLLVWLNSGNFNFGEAQPGGGDIRFESGTGTPLVYQIERWDPAGDAACVWVRIPTIKGNARQEIKMFWGKAGAGSESNGKRVFGTDAGFAGVWHLGDDLEDSTSNNLNGSNNGSTKVPGIIGGGHAFGLDKLIKIRQAGGKPDGKVDCMPSGNQDRSMSAWINPTSYEGLNWASATIGGWDGITQGSKANEALSYMTLSDRGQVIFHLYGADPRSSTRVSLDEWHHVALSVSGNKVRYYLDGVLDQNIAPSGKDFAAIAPLKTASPVEVNVGDHGGGRGPFNGALDEVRFEGVARSADWMKLCYENQKPLQTVVGPLVQRGADFAVSQKKIDLLEGKSIKLTAKAGGAQKIYWIINRNGLETVAATDRFAFTMDAGRVTKNELFTLRFKAVFADGVKTIDIPVTVREVIPDPVFTLKAPAKWDGREMIEVVPLISNLQARQAKGAGDVKYDWSVSGMAIIKELAPGKLVLKRSQNSGTLTVTAKASNGGAPVAQTIRIAVKEPDKDAWVQRTPDKDEKPVDNQFYARDDNNEGTLYCNGTLANAADTVFLKLYADDKLIKNDSRKPDQDGSYALAVKLKAGLIKYKVEFGTRSANAETILHKAGNLVCGDAYMINGQSNAEAWADQMVHPYKSEWLRSFGTPITDPASARKGYWGNALSFNGGENRHNLQIGYWGVELGKQCIEQYKMPVCFVNGAAGGTRIDQHLRNPNDPEDVKTIYGRLLWRLRQARLTHGIRGVLWHQGENDQGVGGPAGAYGWETYQHHFMELAAAWKQDFPNIRHYYIFQIWPQACAMGENGSDNRLREAQRTLPGMFSNMGIMSTLGIDPPGGCHYPAAGYAMFAKLMGPLVERDNYGKEFEQSITPPDLKRAYYAGEQNDEIALVFDQPVIWMNSLTGQFYLDGQKGEVISGTVSGNVILLKLKGASTAEKITYLDSKSWSQNDLLRGQNGIAALSFCEVPLAQSKEPPAPVTPP